MPHTYYCLSMFARLTLRHVAVEYEHPLLSPPLSSNGLPFPACHHTRNSLGSSAEILGGQEGIHFYMPSKAQQFVTEPAHLLCRPNRFASFFFYTAFFFFFFDSLPAGFGTAGGQFLFLFVLLQVIILFQR